MFNLNRGKDYEDFCKFCDDMSAMTKKLEESGLLEKGKKIDIKDLSEFSKKPVRSKSDPTNSRPRKRKVEQYSDHRGSYVSTNVASWNIVSKAVYKEIKKDISIKWHDFMREFGKEWRSYDRDKKIKIMSTPENIEEYIKNTNWNKILSIQNVTP